MQHDPTFHHTWCDGLHVALSLPECSAQTAEVEGLKIMLFGTEISTSVAIAGADGVPLLMWPPHLMQKLIRALDMAVRIARGQVAP